MDDRITRRKLLVGGSATLGLTLLAACSKSSSTTISPTPGGSAQPTKGGTAQLSLSGGGPKLVVDPATQVNEPDAVMSGLLYDGLVRVLDDWTLDPQLATKWEPNADLTVWTFTLRDGVVFHNGKPFTAADAEFSLRRVLDKKLGSAIYSRLAPELSPAGVKALNDTTLQLTLTQPDAFLPIALGARHAKIIPAGTTDFNAGIGTGPFKLMSVDQGQLSFQTSRNPSYWQEGLPYLDGVTGLLSNDPQSLMQSVTNGEFDFGGPLDPTAASSVGSSGQILSHKGFLFDNFIMDPTVTPFDDARVRKAFKLALDRQQILDVAYKGFGTIAYDVPVRTSDPFFATSLVQPRDVAEARSLLASAGYPNGIDVTFETAPAGPGMVDFAVVGAQGLAEAGIRMKISQRPAASYWDVVWLKDPFYAAYWLLRHPLDSLNVMFASTAPWNESKFHNTKFDALLQQAARSATLDEQKSVLGQAQTLVVEESGFSNPAWYDELYVQKPRLQGLALNVTDLVSFEGAFVQ